MTTPTIHNQLQTDLIAKIRSAMSDKQWTQDELSRRSGVPQPTISHVLGGYRLGSLATWNKLLRSIEDEVV